jgi:CheY-like chemotaxis protein
VTVDCFSFIPVSSCLPPLTGSVSADLPRWTIGDGGKRGSPIRVKARLAFQSAPARDDHGSVGRILVAEDSLIVRRLVVEMLADGGHTVVGEVGSGTEAIERYRELEPDLVVLDVNMPGCDGFTAAESILAEDGDARIVIASVLLDEQRKARARELGVVAVLGKPFETDVLLAAVDRALG